MDLIPYFEKLGLTNKEARVWLALWQLKKGSVLSIARKAKIKRPTCYHVLEDLAEKNLVSRTNFRGVTDYRTKSLNHLKSYILKQRKLVNKNLPYIKDRYDNRLKKMRLRVYNTDYGLKRLLEKSLVENEKVYFIGNKEDIGERLGLYWQFFLKRASVLNIRPEFKSIDSEIIMLTFSDKIGFVKFSNPIRVFGFRNPELAKVYKKIWRDY